jgi:cytochrome c553
MFLRFILGFVLLFVATLTAGADTGRNSRGPPDTMEERSQGCSTCHGPSGEGNPELGYPRIAGKPAGYLLNQLRNFRDGRRSDPPMTYLLKYLHDDYLVGMAAYFAAQSVPLTTPERSSLPPGDLESGEQLVRRGDRSRAIPACVACHGPQLTGINPGIPGLIGLSSRYISAQLHAWKAGARHAEALDCMSEIATLLNEAQINRAAAWLATQPMPLVSLPADEGSWKTPLTCGSQPWGTHAQGAKTPDPGQSVSEVVKRGEYLARAGGCIACHTRRDGPVCAGGLPINTPHGTLYSPNITPDTQWGIGKWSADDFYRTLHIGQSTGGRLLYPVEPFAAYTKVTRQDSDAIFAYLGSLEPQHMPNHDHELRLPYNDRGQLTGWRSLYFHAGEFKPDPTLTPQWNRGAYLVEGLGHCGTCHTSIDEPGGGSDDKAFATGLVPMQDWYAPTLTLNLKSWLWNWSVEDLVDLLKTGASKRHTVYGPMADVVNNSLQYLSEGDVRAMAVYLKTQQERQDPAPVRSARGTPQVSANVLARGGVLYQAQCSSCHRADGRGQPPAYPPLAGNRSVEMQSANNPVRMVLHGGYPPETPGNPRPYGMPPFAQTMGDDDIAAVVTYVAVSWGNNGQPVSPAEVKALRSAALFD